ncbi:hypothetical protein BDM02DRAFT_3115261 [Thelephora ganbajun]|uniref:Uncharacterized protein n=1 Tax=Thelephora ganbajun TaxID=370292 RepID=A0ACB6ZGB7_THEGA|nr:hypothetical protein BDM02DRAFT_3115261 [Thelephora ganbajun]
MATVARHIRSYYNPETERDELLLETGQIQVSTAPSHSRIHSGIGFSPSEERNVDGDDDQEEGVDPWLVELPYAPAKFNPSLKFVKSVLSYEDINDYIERGHESGLLEGEEKDRDAEEGRKGISSWYRNLSRTNVNTPVPPLVPEASTPVERTTRSGTLGYLVSSSGIINDSVITTPQRTSKQLPTSDPPSQSQEPLQPQPQSSGNTRRRNDWFTSKVLPHPSPIASGSNSPIPGQRPPPTLADMLARDPPPNKSQEAYTPPTWIMLPPSNPGFRMLQKSGWSEGEPLGPYFARRRDVVHEEQQPVAGPSNLGKRRVAPETRTTEIEIEGYDDIVEIKKEQVIDLTVSDGEEDASSGYEDTSDEDTMELDEALRSFNLPLATPNPASARPSPPQREGHGGKALLTPLPTVLKSDRLGIGLKAKTVGPYKASQKRVTHNAAALAAHVKADEERKLFKQKVGRGSRGFARAERRESEKRKHLLAYLNQ